MIIGITGTNGAGKGVLVEYLATKKGFTHFSARTFIRDEVERRGLPLSRDTLRDVANELRKQHGPAYIVESLFKDASKERNAVIESIRAVGEALFLLGEGAHIIAIDADRKERYDRITARDSETDRVTFERFCEQEDREMSSTDTWDMNIHGVMELAAARIMNKGSLEELYAQIDQALTKLS